MTAEGMITTTANAYGKLILPTGDTLSPALRVKTVQTVFNISEEPTDDASKDKLQETYSRYSKGYRYPVFKTIKNISLADSTMLYGTSFFSASRPFVPKYRSRKLSLVR